MANIIKLVKINLKVNKTQIIIWSTAIFSLMFLYMILFPSVGDLAQLKFEAMPKELMQFFGMEDFTLLATHTGYFGMIYNLILIAISIFIAIFSANIILNEEKSKTIDFLYSLNTTRGEIFFSKFLTSYIALMIVLISAFTSVMICGFINGGETFSLIETWQILKISSITTFVFLGIGTMLSGISSKIPAGTIASMLVLVMYMFGFFSSIAPDSLSFFKYLSPFEMLNPENAVNLTFETMVFTVIYFFIMIVFTLIGWHFYKKRDFQ